MSCGRQCRASIGTQASRREVPTVFTVTGVVCVVIVVFFLDKTLIREQVFTTELCLRSAGFGCRAWWSSLHACFECKCSHLPPLRLGEKDKETCLVWVAWFGRGLFPDFCGDLCGHRRCNFCHGGLRDDSCTRHHPASPSHWKQSNGFSVVFRQSDVATEQAICLGTLHLHTNTHKHVGQTCVCWSSSQ